MGIMLCICTLKSELVSGLPLINWCFRARMCLVVFLACMCFARHASKHLLPLQQSSSSNPLCHILAVDLLRIQDTFEIHWLHVPLEQEHEFKTSDLRFAASHCRSTSN